MEIVDDTVLVSGLPANFRACTQRQIKVCVGGGVQLLLAVGRSFVCVAGCRGVCDVDRCIQRCPLTLPHSVPELLFAQTILT